MKPRLYIFAKAPKMGKAKTRLAAGIGLVHAQRVYRAMTARVVRNCQSDQWETYLYVTPDDQAGQTFGGVWPRRVPRLLQGSGGLSQRLAKIFSSRGPIIAIGTDAPQVSARDIASAIKALRHHDAVFGPATDGGFWLIGMNGPVPPQLFDGIRWSHEETLADMKGAIDGSIAQLRRLNDVDDLTAYQDWKQGG